MLFRGSHEKNRLQIALWWRSSELSSMFPWACCLRTKHKQWHAKPKTKGESQTNRTYILCTESAKSNDFLSEEEGILSKGIHQRNLYDNFTRVQHDFLSESKIVIQDAMKRITPKSLSLFSLSLWFSVTLPKLTEAVIFLGRRILTRYYSSSESNRQCETQCHVMLFFAQNKHRETVTSGRSESSFLGHFDGEKFAVMTRK